MVKYNGEEISLEETREIIRKIPQNKIYDQKIEVRFEEGQRIYKYKVCTEETIDCKIYEFIFTENEYRNKRIKLW